MEFEFSHMWAAMGPVAKGVVYTLLLMSVGTLGVGIERALAFMRAAGESKRFALEIRGPLDDRQFETVGETQKRYKRSPLAQVVGAGVSEYDDGLKKQAAGATYDVVEAATRASERSIDAELTRLRRGLGILATVGSTAPFVGLFGTTFGIINAFQAMGGGAGDLATIGPGIAEALLTTAFGIAVAVIGVWFYNAYTAKVDGIGGALVAAKNEIVDYLIKDQGRAGAAGSES
ncbi:MAG: MotA/TolQ/ExbB proton channel family protein [Deltaproteobacteria bacterium]|nr:MotA/TolQ/ExbB proton channel family protein [Deltaproteobacteria bacterium]